MKARRVKGLDPDGALSDNLERIIRVRLDEALGFAPKALNPSRVKALHDMRIAFKRLRYLLEMSDHLFGPYTATAAKRAKEMQDLLGEIHDCDETLPRLDDLIARQQAAAVASLRERGGDAEDLDPAVAHDIPGADAWRGLHALTAFTAARRKLLFQRFLEHWTELERQGFRARLEYALSERPEPESAGTLIEEATS